MDGYQPDTKKCYEFAGCFYHGCVRCCAHVGLNPVVRETYGVLYGQLTSKVNKLKVRYGHEVEVMWECEWFQRKKIDSIRPSVFTELQETRTSEPMRGSVWRPYKCNEAVSHGVRG